jgi:aerobic-type carbon monoxide dehydrogenase small subunit (CoxS/CutS family)
VQKAFLHEGAFQCGYCTTGMIMATVALLARKPKPSDTEIVEGMNGNLCRCCSYVNIVAAVKRASELSGDTARGAAAGSKS